MSEVSWYTYGMGTAEQIAAYFTEACAAWSLDEASVAARAHLDLDTARSALAGDADASDLAAIARSLGGTLDDVLVGRRFWEAPAVAFKNAPASFELPLLRATLLRLSSAARERDALNELLALPDAPAAALNPAPVAEHVTAQAADLAQRVRSALDNEGEPIASIRQAMRRLGVWTFLSDFGTEDVDGLTWRDATGRACSAANTRARGGKLTALRMTLAHELCHALFDGTKLSAFGVVERRSDHQDGVEQRANAFAAHLLAPEPALRRFLRERGLRADEKPSAAHVKALSEHFGMGVEAVAGHLVSCSLWEKADRQRHRNLFTRDHVGEDNAELHPTSAEEQVALERRGDVLELATLALERGDITAGRWREILGLGPEDDWRGLLAEQQIGQDVEQRSAV